MTGLSLSTLSKLSCHSSRAFLVHACTRVRACMCVCGGGGGGARVCFMYSDKDGLWTEVLTLRQQVTKQDAVIKKLLGFIGQCVTQGSLPMKRPHLAITQVGELDGSPYKMGSLTTPVSI